MGSYVPSTQEERQKMLQAIGLNSVEELYQDVPSQMLLHDQLNLPTGMSELEVGRALSAMAAKNKAYATILRGAGAYDHYIPSIVKYIPAKEEFLTAYTPYQAEMSQGLLQSIFEYQTMICELTGMDVSNASVYDGATAAAEAAAMCRDRKRHVTLISATTHPDVINTVRTYCYGTGDELKVVPMKDGRNICSNEALCALTAGLYMATMGPDGMTQAAEQSMAKAHYLAGKLTALDGVELAYDGAYFQEFVTTLPQRDGVLDALDAQGILGGLPLGEDQILWCATEKVSKAELDKAAAIVEEVLAK